MLKNLKGYYYPRTVPEALGILRACAPRAAVIAGGTHVARSRGPGIDYLVDITRLGLDECRQDRRYLRIGAACTFQHLIDSPLAGRFAGGLLALAAAAVSTQLIRNAGTVGGAIVQGLSCNDVPLALLALDATVVVQREGEPAREISLEDLQAASARSVLVPDDLITELRVPLACAGWGGHYRKFGRTSSEWEGLAQVAVALERRNGTCSQARIALGGLTPRPVRGQEAELLLAGRAITPELCRRAARSACEHLEPAADPRAGKAYRRELAEILVQRGIQAAWEQAAR